MKRDFAPLAGSCLAILFSAAALQADEAGNHFDRSIAPLLAARCLDCHSSSEKKGELDLSSLASALRGGESGKVIVPGKPDESELWKKIAEGEMPPKKPLQEQEKKLIREWIASGAKWGSDPIDPFRFTTASRAGYDWWSLRPIVRPPLPAVNQTDWSQTPVDRFILAELERNKLSPSGKANRQILARRLSFDLIGLPPSEEEVRNFEADPSPDAIERYVDRLLASPHYGERWGRHWLDVARFGESQGFERDKLRTNSWPYRDWVVSALNRDLPYDEFARMQLAGDSLRPNDPAGVIATGFLVAGPYDEVGQQQQSAAMRAVVQQDETEEILGTISQSFLGLTVNCARCHDHKFDPVRQSEYYRMAASIGGVRHGERRIAILSDQERQGIEGELKSLREQRAQLERGPKEKVLAARKERGLKGPPPPKAYASWDFDSDLRDSSGDLHATASGGAKLEKSALQVDGKAGYAATAPIQKDLGEKTLVASVRLSTLNQMSGAAISVQSLDGNHFDAIVFAEKEKGRWMAGSDFYRRTNSFQAPPEIEADRRAVQIAIVYLADGTIIGYRDGAPYGKPYRSGGLQKFPAGKTQVLFGLRHLPAHEGKFLSGGIESAQLFDRALSAEEVLALSGKESDKILDHEIAAHFAPEELANWRSLGESQARLERRLLESSTRTVYAANSIVPPPSQILRRGNPAQPIGEAPPGAIASVGTGKSDFGLGEESSDLDRRRKLAEWIASEHNPLFARAIVNRLWHYHFGIGLVDTPNDLGFNGGRPTHPELLDWLAADLMENGWSLKSLHRSIVLSATYQQQSLPRPDGLAVDAANRKLWRKSPQRLEAESLRDSMLFATGELNLQIGGPGFQDFTTFTANSQFYQIIDPVGPAFQRRSLYRTWVRSGRSPLLDVFDCPDPSTKAPARAVTTTPLQALALLNNSFVLRMSETLAARARQSAGEDSAKQVEFAFRHLLGRPPTSEEKGDAAEVVARHGLAPLCRALLNSNEFLYVE